MSTTLTRARTDRASSADPPRFAGNAHARRPIAAIASLAVVTFCIAIFTTIYLHAGDRVAVLALTHDVPQGQPIARSDLTVVNLSLSPGLTPILLGDLDEVIGRSAGVPLVRGTLLTASELTEHHGPARGKAIVGVATKPGQLPAGGVEVGDSVDVILTGSAATLTGGVSDGSTATSSAASSGDLEIGGVLATNATVTGVTGATDPNADSNVVSVLIPSSLAPLVASASAAGQVALVLVEPTS